MLVRIFILFILLSTQSAYSQSDDLNQSDSDVELNETGRDSTTIVGNAFFDIFYGKPGKAALYGLVAPGGGQIYNKRWWKLPFVYAIEGGLIWWIVYSTQSYDGYNKAYIFNLRNPTLDPRSFRGTSNTSILLSNRNSYRKQKEYSWIFFIGGHLITIFEAFIDRHLMEFDVSDDLTFEPVPSVIGPIPGFTYTIDFGYTQPTSIKVR